MMEDDKTMAVRAEMLRTTTVILRAQMQLVEDAARLHDIDRARRNLMMWWWEESIKRCYGAVQHLAHMQEFFEPDGEQRARAAHDAQRSEDDMPVLVCTGCRLPRCVDEDQPVCDCNPLPLQELAHDISGRFVDGNEVNIWDQLAAKEKRVEELEATVRAMSLERDATWWGTRGKCSGESV